MTITSDLQISSMILFAIPNVSMKKKTRFVKKSDIGKPPLIVCYHLHSLDDLVWKCFSGNSVSHLPY